MSEHVPAAPADALDRFLRYDELAAWLHRLAADHPHLVAVESYGRSHEGRDLWLATVTDRSTGAHDTKPALWTEANIHATEVTGGVAALSLLHHLVTRHAEADPVVVEALRSRTFYVAPRVNPDGVEAALADSPRFLRSSVRPWPWRDAHRWPGLHEEDVDGDGRILRMRLVDPNGAWREHPLDPRVMVPVGPGGAEPGVVRYRLLGEGVVLDYDGFTVPTPDHPAGLDLNRNFPAGWGTTVRGSGDHPLSEPEIDALVRAVTARPNICGYHALHTFGGMLLRPSSTRPDSALPRADVWTWNELGRRGTELTGYPVHSVYEDLTWDTSDTMSGAADDWAYEHLGVLSWTIELWDVIAAATGERASTDLWDVGPTPEQELAVARWADEHAPGTYVPWYPFDHPQLGPVELGGVDAFRLWVNAPASRLRQEVAPLAEFAVHHALASPRLELLVAEAEPLGGDGRGGSLWRVRAGVANTGWLPTDVSRWARQHRLVRPVVVEVRAADGAPLEVLGAPARARLGQLEGRVSLRWNGWSPNDGTPDRALHAWVVRADPGRTVSVVASHPRAGRAEAVVVLR